VLFLAKNPSLVYVNQNKVYLIWTFLWGGYIKLIAQLHLC
jgi:hypothetical protein